MEDLGIGSDSIPGIEASILQLSTNNLHRDYPDQLDFFFFLAVFSHLYVSKLRFVYLKFMMPEFCCCCWEFG